MTNTAFFRFYGSLNDFLPASKKEKDITYAFKGTPAVKDAIEALVVPHPEVNVILVTTFSVGWDYRIQANETVAVYLAGFYEFGKDVSYLQASLPKGHTFILDVHLGKLAKALRLLGFNTIYQTNYDDKTIAQQSAAENRIVLTRDIGLLKHKAVQRGYWLRSQHLEEQLTEVLTYFNLSLYLQPFTRCLVCNGSLQAVPKEAVIEKLPPTTKLYFQEFYQCSSCERVFWKGSHYDRMETFVQRLYLK